jgi:GR25 family glycosyltransferase involved in LPS biosynthesis
MIKGYIISSALEESRQLNIDQLVAVFPFLIEKVEAIYPSKSKVSFKKTLLAKSAERTGKSLTEGELGCLLSHRAIWKKIVNEAKTDTQHYIIFESDSVINDANFIKDNFEKITTGYDLFFWGAWEGHLKLFNSTKRKWKNRYEVGEPFIKTVYCTYGYSLNKIAAQLLLNKTVRVSYPVDQFKRFIHQRELRLGGIVPEVVSGNQMGSYIRLAPNVLKEKIFRAILDIKNIIICQFK